MNIAVRRLITTAPLLAETTAFFGQLATKPAGLRANQYDKFIRELVWAGVWQKLDVVNLWAAANEATALANLKSSLYQTANAGVTFTADQGFAYNAGLLLTTDYPRNYTVQYTQNSASFFVWTQYSGTDADQLTQAGSLVVTSLFPKYTDNKMYVDLNTTTDDPGVTVSSAAGLYGGSRLNTALSRYQNGVNVGTRTDTSVAVPNAAFETFKANYPGTASALFAGAALTDQDARVLYNATRRYLQAVSGVA